MLNTILNIFALNIQLVQSNNKYNGNILGGNLCMGSGSVTGTY